MNDNTQDYGNNVDIKLDYDRIKIRNHKCIIRCDRTMYNHYINIDDVGNKIHVDLRISTYEYSEKINNLLTRIINNKLTREEINILRLLSAYECRTATKYLYYIFVKENKSILTKNCLFKAYIEYYDDSLEAYVNPYPIEPYEYQYVLDDKTTNTYLAIAYDIYKNKPVVFNIHRQYHKNIIKFFEYGRKRNTLNVDKITPIIDKKVQKLYRRRLISSDVLSYINASAVICNL